jgi:hypothetical protein
MMGNVDHKHQMAMHLHGQRCDAIHGWRTGLADARDAYQRWACGSREGAPPSVVGDAWFEGLRPHLPTTGEAAKYRTAHEVHCDNPTLALLSLEIGRIETDWIEEAKGRRRRQRSRPRLD